jgi:hypothetical protein
MYRPFLLFKRKQIFTEREGRELQPASKEGEIFFGQRDVD